MREAIRIIRKDVYRFRPQLAGYLGLMGIFAWMEAALPRRPALLLQMGVSEILLLLAAGYLVVMSIHQETLPGDCQYWLTRPISWRGLLLAKALFILMFLNLPVLAVNIGALLSNGLSPLAYLAPLLAKQGFLIAFVVLPAMALAAITRNFSQFAIWIFCAFAAVLVIGLELAGNLPGRQWDGFEWILTSGLGSLALMILTGVLLLQYARRRTLLSQSILAATLLSFVIAPALNLWHGAFVLQGRELQSRRSQRPHQQRETDASAIRVALEPARDLALGRGALAAWRGTQDFVRIFVPVQVTGIPAGMEVYSEHIAVTVEIPGGPSWSSGWSSLGGTLRQTGDERLLPADGAYWQYMKIDRAFFEKIRDTPAHLHTIAAFTLFAEARTTRLTPPTTARWAPEAGFCSSRASGGDSTGAIRGFLSVVCLSPFQHADRVEILMQSRRTGLTEGSGVRLVSYSPYQTDLTPSLWTAIGADMLVNNPSDEDILIEARQAVAHFERDLDVREIRLAQYQDARVRAMPGAKP
jgi:hypothetical protein